MARSPCWIFRYEALGYESAGWALTELMPDELRRWCDEAGYTGEVDDEGFCGDFYDVLSDLCELDEGHEGEHRFVRQSQVTLTFGPTVAAAQK